MLADHMMWHQYVNDHANTAHQAAAAENVSVRASLRRMSRMVLVHDSEHGQGASVLPEARGPNETGNSPEAHVLTDGTGGNKRSTILNTLVTLANTVVVVLVAVGYPVAILPYYRAKSTTE